MQSRLLYTRTLGRLQQALSKIRMEKWRLEPQRRKDETAPEGGKKKTLTRLSGRFASR